MTGEPLTEVERGITLKELQAIAPFEVTDKLGMVWLPDGRCFSREGKRWYELDHDSAPTPA